MSIDYVDRAWRSFIALGNLLRDLGVHESIEKSVAPTHLIEFLGILFDLLRMLIFLPQDKLVELRQLLQKWRHTQVCTKKELQSIAGKLQFAATCVRPGRVFIIRIYGTIAMLEEGVKYNVPLQVKEDLKWWEKYLEEYNGCSLMWLVQCDECDKKFTTDACLTGIGALNENRYYHSNVEKFMEIYSKIKINIAHLEMLAIVIGLKLWKEQISGCKFKIGCDNKVVLAALNAGKSKDLLMQDLLREVTYLLATSQSEMVVRVRFNAEQHNTGHIIKMEHKCIICKRISKIKT